MNLEVIVGLISALLAAAPTLSADAVALIQTLTQLFTSNPAATAADVQAAIATALSQASAADAAVEADGNPPPSAPPAPAGDDAA